MYNNRKPTAVEPPTVKAIVGLYLREHGYDALMGHGCGCRMDDFMPCGAPIIDCVAAYFRPATQNDVDEDRAREVGAMMYSPKKEG
jgi:hypothetical protein